jgi:hypothetical protein
MVDKIGLVSNFVAGSDCESVYSSHQYPELVLEIYSFASVASAQFSFGRKF